MYSTLNTTNNCVTTNSTTRVDDNCEVCEQYGPTIYHGNFYDSIDEEILNLSNYTGSWRCLCDKHKKEYDVKFNMKLRKSKLEKINEYNDVGS
jgi:hypothetical protein